MEKGNAGEITIKFNEDGTPSIKLKGDLPDATRDHVQELMGWIQKEKKDEGAQKPTDDPGLGPNNSDPNEPEKPEGQLPEGPPQLDPRATGGGTEDTMGLNAPAPKTGDPTGSTAPNADTGKWGDPVEGNTMSPAPHNFTGQDDMPPPQAEDDDGPEAEGGVYGEGADGGQPQILPEQPGPEGPGVLKEDAGLSGLPFGNQAPKVRNIPAELRAGPTPDLYGPSSQHVDVDSDSHVKPPGSQVPIMDEFQEQSAKEDAQESQEISTEVEDEDKAPDLFQQPEQDPAAQAGQPGEEQPQPPPQPGEEQDDSSNWLPPPKNFDENQWNQLKPNEQIEYYELLEHMNDSIDRHDHDGLRNTVTKLSEYQRKMKQAMPEPEMGEEGAPVEGAPEDAPKKEKKPALPTLTIEGKPPAGLTMKSVLSVSGERHEVPEDSLASVEKSAKAPHVSHPKHHRPPRGGDYIRRWWDKGRWQYEYAKKPHENPKHHGVGENAVRAASLKLEHTIDVHPELVDHPDVANAYEAYRKTVQKHNGDSPEKITWVKEGTDGKHHVYRQNVDKQSEVSYVKRGDHPSNPQEVPMQNKHRISLSAYNKKHMRKLHTPDVGDPSLGWGVVAEFKNPDGSPLAKLYHEESTAKPWILKEEGVRVLTADQPSNFRRFYSREAAQRFVDFHQWYEKAQQNNRGVELFENSGAASSLDPEKYPTLHDLETGKMRYKAVSLTDERTGMKYRALVPDLTTQDMESLFHDELKDVIKRSVHRFLQLHRIPATRDVKKSMYKAAQSLAWERLLIRFGGKKSGGFVPGAEGRGVRALIGSVLRARSGPLLEELHDLTTTGESSMSDDQQQALYDRVFGDSSISFRGTVTGEEWIRDHREDWIAEQQERWLLHHGQQLSPKERETEGRKLVASLNRIANRNQAFRFASRNSWAKKPVVRGIVTSIAEPEQGTTPEEEVSLAQTQQRLSEVAQELGAGDPKKEKFYSRLMANLFSGVVEALPSIMMEEMGRIWHGENEEKLQTRFVKYMEKFRSHPDVQELRTAMAMSVAQSRLNMASENLVKSHPAYRRVMDFMIKGKCHQFLNRVVEQIDPERTVKSIVLKRLVPSIVNGNGGEVVDQLCSVYQKDIGKHVGDENISVEDCKKHVAEWYGDLRSHNLFKSVLWFSAAKSISERADLAKKIASNLVVASFVGDAVESI